MEDTKNSGFCVNFFKRYYECLRINIQVFGKDNGVVMCDNIKNIIDNSDCKYSDHELNIKMSEFIDKLVKKVENEK